ncbi:copia protein [Tanacetum coccineum]
MLQGKLIFFGDDGKPLKSKSVYANDSFVKANDGAKLTGNRDVSYANLLNGVLIWVKFHDIPFTAFTKDGLSAIATKFGTPLMSDVHTTTMCTESWGRSSYARAMIDLRAHVELKDTLVVEIQKIEGDVEDSRSMGYFGTISEKEVNNLKKHGPKPNRVEVVNNDKRVTVELGSMPSTSMDLQDDNSKSDV